MSDNAPLSEGRRAVGIWAEWPEGARWSNEGMTRLLGFLIEGIARGDDFVFRIALPDSIRDAAEADLSKLDAEIGRDFTLHSPRDAGIEGGTFQQLADFANQHVPVEAWLTLFPNFSSANRLDAPVTVVFPDAIPKSFHEFGDRVWGSGGFHNQWEGHVRQLLSHARGVITFSDHVARDHAGSLFGVPRDRVTVVPHAAPDLKPLLPFLEARKQTDDSLREAAQLLRDECASRDDYYLRHFPFEEVPYLAVSTQDRVTKNLQLAARALLVLLRERRVDMKMLTTATLHFDESWAVLPHLVEETQSQFDILAIPDLPRQAHAAFLHCAAVAVHPSLFEGGHAPFPFYEAVSVGTPCIMALGPHIEELSIHEPEIAEYCFDPTDAQRLANLVTEVIANRDEVARRQGEIYRRLQRTDWAGVAKSYAEAALLPIESGRSAQSHA